MADAVQIRCSKSWRMPKQVGVLTVRLAWSKTRRNSAEFMPSSRPGVAADSVVSAYDEVIQISLVLCVECKNVDHNEGVNAPGLPSRSVYEPNVSVFKDNSPTVKWRFGKRATFFPSSAPLLPAPGLPQTPLDRDFYSHRASWVNATPTPRMAGSKGPQSAKCSTMYPLTVDQVKGYQIFLWDTLHPLAGISSPQARRWDTEY